MHLEALQLCLKDITGKVKLITEGMIEMLLKQFSSSRMHPNASNHGLRQFHRAVIPGLNEAQRSCMQL